MNVEFSANALTDLVAIFAYLNPLNPAAAERTIAELDKRCRALSRYPERGSPALVRHGVSLRKIVVGRYVVLYEILNGTIVITAVVHGARDYDRVLRLRLSRSDED
jgi:plasmid stabilization system protein ParE